jgi:hypothetical protein
MSYSFLRFRIIPLVVSCLAGAVSLSAAPPLGAQEPASTPSSPAQTESIKIPAGTILPVVLRSTLSFENSKAGQILRGQIAQTVPLPDGRRIPKGSRVEGTIVQASPASAENGARLSFQFDKVKVGTQWVPVTTNLRAVAGFMEIQEAQVPEEAPDQGSPHNWLPTTQIGGDTVYGVGGPVMSAHDTSEQVGKAVNDGVLVRVSAQEGTKCRGAVAGNDKPQALWVFSSDACGVYGIEKLEIIHAGRTDPKGVIVLASEKHNLKLRSGDGLLLRVD